MVTALWTLCDPLHEERGICLTIDQARAIRRHNLLREEALERARINEKERADKATARLEATASESMLNLILSIVLPPFAAAAAAIVTYEVTKRP